MKDLQTKDIQANLHEFDHIFSEFTLDEDVYATLARPEVTRAQGGGQAAIVVFGHSDTGKTHNMLGIEERIRWGRSGAPTNGTSHTTSSKVVNKTRVVAPAIPLKDQVIIMRALTLTVNARNK